MMSTKRWRGLLLALAIALPLTACGPTQVLVEGDFPSPIIEPLPVTLGVWYPEAFRNHEFFDEAKTPSESSWVVKTGEAQVQMWDSLLAGMFDGLVHVRNEPGPGTMNQMVDGILIPQVVELQYAIPAHTNVKVYEIWMRYRFQLVNGNGSTIADWTMSSYGKTPTAFLQSDQQAVNLAAVMALRDAGANFATGFSSVAEVQDWLQQRGLRPSEETAPP